MMFTTVKAVYENGVLRPQEPLDLEDGQEVDVQIWVHGADQPQHERISALLTKWAAEPDDTSDEWWDEFDAFLKANRLNFPERDLGLEDK
jgi:predicted DNA-binding antitoxin AbrB/MazE fold protein